jgi:hypothetical protein
MVSIRAHFDGKVFVPDEPVELPRNATVRLLVTESENDRRSLGAEGGSGAEDDGAELNQLGESGLTFWDNEIDDEVWNDAAPPA